jgi:hypothetical protein
MYAMNASLLTSAVVCWLATGLSVQNCAYAQGAAPPPSSGQSIPADTLNTLLAPIALYPDALVIQIVQCAGSPYQVKQVNDWLKSHPDLKGTDAQDAAVAEGFDASFVAIVLFPQVLEMMASQPEWTKELGAAFVTDRDGVLEAVQRLRKEAMKVGNLVTTPQQTVETVRTETGQQVIVIQPTNPQIVYVPVYNPQVVYTQPVTTTTTVYKDNSGQVAAAGIIGFAAGVIVGAAIDNDDHYHYYSYGGWGYHRPVCYPGGYNDYYRHRENMANDYYDHRENMAEIRGDNRSDIAGNRDTRQANVSDNRDARQTNVSGNRDTRQTNVSDNRDTRQTDVSDNRTARQTATTRTGDASRTRTQPAAVPKTTDRAAGNRSGAFSGYQSGATTRASSARGAQSMSRSGGARGGGGGGGRRGG